MRDNLPEELLVNNVLYHCLCLHVEHLCTEIRAIGSRLARFELTRDLRPVRIALHGEENVRMPYLRCHSEHVVQCVPHVSIAADEG